MENCPPCFRMEVRGEMKMSIGVWSATEESIDKAYKEHNVDLLHKEAQFLMTNLSCSMPEVFSSVLDAMKPERVKFRKEPDFLFSEQNLSNLKHLLSLSEKIYMDKNIDFMDVKLDFDAWFYKITTEGVVSTMYKTESLLSITDAAGELGVTRTTIYKYIDRGLETVGAKGSQKIPKAVLEAWKDPATAFKLQWLHAVKKERMQTTEDKLEDINKQIGEFEKEYNGTFHSLFSHLSDVEIDMQAEAVDISDWKELENRKEELLKKLEN